MRYNGNQFYITRLTGGCDMDVISMKNPVAPMRMQQGEFLNGITSKMWIERYALAGEFRFVAPVSSGLRQKLPIGSFVTHLNTPELMIVETHEISDKQDEESIITVSGRGFETYLEQRIVGSNRHFPRVVADTAQGKYIIPAKNSWDQIVQIINQHLSAGYLVDDSNALAFITVNAFVNGSGVKVTRKIDIRDLYSTVLELLAIDTLGIRIIRPGFWSPLPHGSPNMLIRIHKGIDRTDKIIFSYDSGQIINADYLWSNKNLKTSALVVGKWLQTMVHLPGFTNYERRMMQVSAQDVDEDYEETELLANWLKINSALKARGREALKSQKDVVLTKAEVSKKTVESRYRVDFNVGDLVRVVGDYNESSVMRVSEFVEIEDENGTVAYPTLSLEKENA